MFKYVIEQIYEDNTEYHKQKQEVVYLGKMSGHRRRYSPKLLNFETDRQPAPPF